MAERQQHRYFSQRRAGVLLHFTSLPNAFKGGLLGEDTLQFLDFLARSGFSAWQMLPVQPVDLLGSPYQSCSVHAGNPDFITLQQTKTAHPVQNRHEVYRQIVADIDTGDFNQFKLTHAAWLQDYALYSAIKKIRNGRPWTDWPEKLKYRDQTALISFGEQYRDLLEYYQLEQFIFFSQWQQLRIQAAERGILLIGDMPIFPGHDSADVWAQPELFKLDAQGRTQVVAGVPPDYFSANGQRWGNPVYDWVAMAADNFQWWIERVRSQLALFDMVRIDHFRGLDATWEIPAQCETAEQGKWETVPGQAMLDSLYFTFAALPLIAEDLGIITPSVTSLRKQYRLPGMAVLQFAFDSDAHNPYLPHNHKTDGVIYSGTHDNNTTLGWYDGLDDSQRSRIREYCANTAMPMPWPIIQMALESVCNMAILPMQDLLELGAEHRMNTPGTLTGNWQWKFEWDWIKPGLPEKLKHLNQLYGR